MRKVTSGLFISLDGVVEAPHLWQFDVFDEDMGDAMTQFLADIDTVLLGRVTYQEWAAYWPNATTDGEYAVFINDTPKYVASTTLNQVDWRNSTLITGDVATAVADLKAQSGGNIGIQGSPTRELYFDNVRIPDSRRIGEVGEGFAIAMQTLDHTRVTIGAQAVGIAQGALDAAAAYAKERSQFGKAIAEFQGIQFMLADMAMKLEAARQLVYVAAAKSERGDADLTFFGAAAKCFASDAAMEITTDAVQVLGGYGYVKDYPVERMMRDAKITQIYEGTNQVQRIVMARKLLEQY
mgnify:CR=1 FL=1